MLLSQEQIIVCCTVLECNSCGYPKTQFLAVLKARGVEFPLRVIKSLCKLNLIRFDSANGRSRREGVFKPLPLLWGKKDELLGTISSLGGSDDYRHALGV